MGGFVRQRNKGKVSARYLRRVELDIVSLPLSLKTVHCTVFAFGTLAFESLSARHHRNNETEAPFMGTSVSLLVRQQGLEPRTDRL